MTLPDLNSRPGARPVMDSSAAGARAAWERRPEDPAAKANTAAALRRRGLLQSAVGLVAGTLIWFFWHRYLAPVVWTLAALNGLAAIASPTGVYAAISRGLEALGRGIGRVLTVVLLTPVYWLFFAPFGLLRRRGRRDRLTRWIDPRAETYWRRREDEEMTLERYERQF